MKKRFMDLFKHLTYSQHTWQVWSDFVMANITSAEDAIQTKGYANVNDCACGAGATLIAFANAAKSKEINYQQQLLFVGQDIDTTAAHMCYIQLSLLGCAGYVIISNTLSSEQPKPDDVWYTPMYFSKIWAWRRVFQSLDDIERRRQHEFTRITIRT